MIKITRREADTIIKLFEDSIFDLKYGNLNREINGLITNMEEMKGILKMRIMESISSEQSS